MTKYIHIYVLLLFSKGEAGLLLKGKFAPVPNYFKKERKEKNENKRKWEAKTRVSRGWRWARPVTVVALEGLGASVFPVVPRQLVAPGESPLAALPRALVGLLA